jgi:hypothetical protein
MVNCSTHCLWQHVSCNLPLRAASQHLRKASLPYGPHRIQNPTAARLLRHMPSTQHTAHPHAYGKGARTFSPAMQQQAWRPPPLLLTVQRSKPAGRVQAAATSSYLQHAQPSYRSDHQQAPPATASLCLLLPGPVRRELPCRPWLAGAEVPVRQARYCG